jgi:Uma2 family endonuclease
VSTPARGPATLREFLAIPVEQRFHELIDGHIIEKAEPSFDHGDAQSSVALELKGPFQRGRGPGGWWIVTEVEVLLEGNVYRPDVSGWRRERLPSRPTKVPVETSPDWVCEIVSPNSARDDRVKKLRAYQHAAVPHYWLLDTREGSLTVLRHAPDGYLVVLTAQRGERVRAEPFDAIELDVSALFGE